MRTTKCNLVPAVVALIGALTCSVASADAQTWNLLVPAGPSPTGRTFHGATSVYDPSTNRMIMFGGRDASSGPSHTNLNDVWVLTDTNGLGGTAQWIQLFPSGNLPEPRSGHTAVYDAVSNSMMVFGGCEFGCTPLVPPTVWVLSNANGLGGTPSWLPLSTAGGGPSPRVRHTAVYDPGSNSMIIFAGQDGSGFGCSTFSDVWVLSNANGLGGTPTWTQISPSGGPPAGQYSPTAVYDPGNNRMTVFGGDGIVGGNCQASNAVWVLSNANGTGGPPVWTNLVAEGASGSPAARSFHTAVYSTPANLMTIFGGQDPSGELGDVWTLSDANGLGATPAWTQIITPSTSPAARDSQTAVLDALNDRMIVFGGEDSASVPLNDVWVLANTQPPRITIESPTATTYKLDQAVAANYSCMDEGSGVATCAGAVPNGSNIDTASVGSKTFTVNSADNAGTTSTLSVSYRVGYGVCVLYDTTHSSKSGSTIPIKFQLSDAAGNDVSSDGLTVGALQVVMVSTNASSTVLDSGNANPDSNFRFDATLGPTGGYIFNLNTAGLATGTYVLTFVVSGDPTTHNSELLFQIR